MATAIVFAAQVPAGWQRWHGPITRRLRLGCQPFLLRLAAGQFLLFQLLLLLVDGQALLCSGEFCLQSGDFILGLTKCREDELHILAMFMC